MGQTQSAPTSMSLHLISDVVRRTAQPAVEDVLVGDRRECVVDQRLRGLVGQEVLVVGEARRERVREPRFLPQRRFDAAEQGAEEAEHRVL